MWRQSLPNLLEARRWAAPMAEATDLRALRKPAADLALAARVADAAERRAALILAVREFMLAFMAASTSLASLARAPAMAARPAAFLRAAARSLALALEKHFLAIFTAATRFFLASAAAERTA